MGEPTEQGRAVGPETSRRKLLQMGAAGAVGAVTWHAPSLRIHDLRGARLLAAASGPLVALVDVTSFTRTTGTRSYQHWTQSGDQRLVTVGFPSGNVQIQLGGRATASNVGGTNANGTWALIVNTLPDGCATCEVSSISMSCPAGTTSVSGVPGTSGNLHCDNSPPDVLSTATASFTVTCT